jgi:hypothetical protein
MNTENQSREPILTVAWTRFAHLDDAALERNRFHKNLRRWVALLGVLATLFAIMTQTFPVGVLPDTLLLVLRILLILTPLVGSALAAFLGQFFTGRDWLVFRAGSENIRKEIYMYRTVLKSNPRRRAWLEKRLSDIQHQVYRGLGGEMVLKQYSGPIPPSYNPQDPNSDPGFGDLTGDEYFTYRVEQQLAWHIGRINRYQQERIRLQVMILTVGVAGALLAALGGVFSLWVALTSSMAAALVGWQELRNLDSAVKNYSKVQLELMVIYDHWNNLEPEERTEGEFFKMVKSTEDLLWSQNVEYIKSMQDAMDAVGNEEAELINNIIKTAVESDARMKKNMRDSLEEFTDKTLKQAEKNATEAFEKTLSTLAEEASSELVQQELEAMGQAAVETIRTVIQRSAGLRETMQQVAAEFSGVEIDKETPAGVLHSIISRYPTTGDLKG